MKPGRLYKVSYSLGLSFFFPDYKTILQYELDYFLLYLGMSKPYSNSIVRHAWFWTKKGVVFKITNEFDIDKWARAHLQEIAFFNQE